MSEAAKDSQKARKGSKLRQRSSGFFSRSGRNSISADRGLDSRSGMLGPLLLDVIPKADTTLTEDKSLSQYLSTQRHPVIPEHPGQANVDYGGRASTSATNGAAASQYARSATMLSRQSSDTAAASDYQYQSTILTLQTKIMTESHEKDAILAKYQALAKLHDAQQAELATARSSTRQATPAVSSAAQPSPVQQPDAKLQQQMQAVVTDLHAFVFARVHVAGVDLAKFSAEDDAIINRAMPSAAGSAGLPKTALLQTLITFNLLEAVQDPLFPGLSSTFEPVRATAALLKDTASAADYDQWRAATASALLSGSNAALTQSTEEFVAQLAAKVNATLANFTGPAAASDAQGQQLESVILAAVTIVRQVKAQNADLDFQLPLSTQDKSSTFDGTLMDKVAANGTLSQANTLQLVLSPVVYYIARGAANLQATKSVLLKAKVLCKS